MKISIAKLSQMKAIELRNKKQNKNWMGSMLRKEKTYWTHFWVQQNTKDTGLTFGSTRKQNILDPLLGPLENKTYWTYFWVHQKTKDTGPTFGSNRIQNILDPLLGPIKDQRHQRPQTFINKMNTIFNRRNNSFISIRLTLAVSLPKNI